MEEDLVARLLANTSLAALVGNRIVWIERPQGQALPSVTLQVISAGRDYHMKGASGLAGTRVQIDCWGASYASAKAVSRALIAAIEPSAQHGNTRFSAAFLESGTDFPPEDIAGGTRVYRVKMDWIIWNSPA
jgi:hypothetical protein